MGRFSDRESYSRYLTIMIAFRGAVEAELPDEFGDALPILKLRGKLLADCDDLNLRPRASSPDFRLPGCREATLGALYVLEGSALGARLLYAQAQAIGLSANFGARHLAAQIAAPERWMAFQDFLESESEINVEQLTVGAQQVFALALDIAERIDHDAAN